MTIEIRLFRFFKVEPLYTADCPRRKSRILPFSSGMPARRQSRLAPCEAYGFGRTQEDETLTAGGI
jgi:hypothetical protein